MTTPFPFTQGQVLTAAQMNAITELPVNDKTASYTLVAGDAGERVIMNSASATTITVDTSVFTAGQLIYITNKGAGVCTITAGTATVSTTGTLALAQFASGVLYCISAGVFLFEAYGVAASSGGFVRLAGAAFSAVTSVTADNVFSATYRNYQIVFDYVAASGSPAMQLRVGGVTTSTNYNFHSLRADNGAVTGTEFASQSSHSLGFDSSFNSSSTAMIFRPFDATPTIFQAFNARTGAAYTKPILLEFFGNQSASTSFDGIIISVSSGTMTGRFEIYGLANS